MITANEIDEWAERFGVPAAQIERDHLVSHLLLALREVLPHEVVFFGGTALCRTHLPDIRLSEDIDLLVEDPRSFLDQISDSVPRAVRREFPRLTIGPFTPSGRSVITRVTAPRVEAIQLQLVKIEPEERRFTYEDRPVALRYSDLPSNVVWSVPDEKSITAMKVKTWSDRFAPRDLFDLWKMAQAGFVTREVHELLRKTIGVGFIKEDFAGPNEVVAAAWRTELNHQVPDLPAFNDVLAEVRAAIENALT